MTIYCPLCNKNSDEIRFIGNFCEDCVVAKLSKNVPETATILQCRWCKRIKDGETFARMSNKSLAHAVKVGLKLKEDVKVTAHTGKEMDAVFIFDVDGEKVQYNRKLPYKIAHETCQRCYRISSGYYEAVVQLRGDKQRIENMIAKLTKYVQRRGGFIAKTEDMDNGKDVYLSDKLMTNTFFKDYDIKPTRSFRLYGMKKGRKLFRNTYSVVFEKVEPKHNTFTKAATTKE
jgi:NMD protein affecting ribosome stability and mRNA decay